ncbi:MAG: hypothetical protein WB767_04590 [Nocardioides sp.]
MAFLSGCGDDDPFAAYCDEVQDQQRPLTEALAQGAPTGLLAALPSFRALAEQAPDDLVDEWAVVTQRLATLERALSAADVDPGSYDPQRPPSGLTDGERAVIETAAIALVEPAMSNALDAVQQQSRDVCKAPLSLS